MFAYDSSGAESPASFTGVWGGTTVVDADIVYRPTRGAAGQEVAEPDRLAWLRRRSDDAEEAKALAGEIAAVAQAVAMAVADSRHRAVSARRSLRREGMVLSATGQAAALVAELERG